MRTVYRLSGKMRKFSHNGTTENNELNNAYEECASDRPVTAR